MNLAVLGAQWGDEGKGKEVDLLAPGFDIVARYAGGHNAGHTVWVDGIKFILRLIPSGILRPHVRCVIGNGCVVEPQSLLEEIADLRAKGINIDDRLLISDRAHLITPWSKYLDEIREQQGGIGSTKNGIGPAYEAKMARKGVRSHQVGLDLSKAATAYYKSIEKLLDEEIRSRFQQDLESFLGAAHKLSHFIYDTGSFLRQELRDAKSVLFEGAQGQLLDIDHGTYPYVTSSSCGAAGIANGLGIPPKAIGGCVGVIKAYTTRVGGGPLPTELHGTEADEVREAGGEYGSRTGRARRPADLDLFQVRYACELNGVDALVVNKGDILDGRGPRRICIGYTYAGRRLRDFPPSADMISMCVPLWREIPGWKKIAGVREWNDLDPNFLAFISQIELHTGVPVIGIGNGAERSDFVLAPPDRRIPDWIRCAFSSALTA